MNALVDELNHELSVLAIITAAHPIGVVGRATRLLDDAERGVKLIVCDAGDGVGHWRHPFLSHAVDCSDSGLFPKS